MEWLIITSEISYPRLQSIWNLSLWKFVLTPKDEGDEPKHYLQVAVSFENIPPKVFMITRRTKGTGFIFGEFVLGEAACVFFLAVVCRFFFFFQNAIVSPFKNISLRTYLSS